MKATTKYHTSQTQNIHKDIFLGQYSTKAFKGKRRG
jgi:hypothetical protein